MTSSRSTETRVRTVKESLTVAEVVTLPWLEWHRMREELKEARRLLSLAVEAARKGDPLDAGQIEGFLR